MISSKTIYLNADKSAAVPEGDKDARFLLVRAGSELSDKDAEKYAGAADLAGAKPSTVKTHNAPAGSKRVEPEPEEPHGKGAAHVRK